MQRATDPGRRGLPILSHLLIDAWPDPVVIAGTDLTVGLRMKIAGDVQKQGRERCSRRHLCPPSCVSRI